MAINSLSPLDGRYQKNLLEVAETFSEKSLIKQRLIVEISWLLKLDQKKALPKILKLTANAKSTLDKLISDFNDESANEIKKLEATTNHDVKALEYWLADNFTKSGDKSLIQAIPAIHFACTSEDINNLALNLQIKQCWENVLSPQIKKNINTLSDLAKNLAYLPILSRTHGQPATPTTLGKELAVFVDRLTKAFNCANQIKLTGKLNGATGNFNAHIIANEKADWQNISKEVINSLGFEVNYHTTQIEPHDRISELFLAMSMINTILIDLVRDLWGYIAFDYFKLKVISGEVGSSTMPHKVNPIDFENAEGNLGVANALFIHFAQKLPISRFQRDLSDSTVQRNVGSAFGYTLLSWKSLARGLSKLSPNLDKISKDLEENWEILTEAVQTVLRSEGVANAYELLKSASRGKKLDEKAYKKLLTELPLSLENKYKLQKLTPAKYLGIAPKLAKLRSVILKETSS